MSEKAPDFMVRGEAYKDDITVPVTIMGNYPSNQTDPVECFVLADDINDLPKVMYQSKEEGRYLELRATKTSPHLDDSWAQHFDDIWIPKLRIEQREKRQKYFDNSIRGIAELLVQGYMSEGRHHNTDFHCYVLLQKTPLLGRLRDDNKAATWNTPFGSAKLIRDLKRKDEVNGRTYEWGYPNQDLIELKIDSTHFNSSRDMVLGIVDYLDEIMWLISFLSRKYIWWYRIDIDGPIKIYGNPHMMKHNRKNRDDEHSHDLLIDLKAFRATESQTLFDNFRNSPIKGKILSLIQYLLITYTDSFFEHELAISHITLEKLVHNFSGRKNIINDGKFKKIRRALKATLDEQKSVDLTPEELEQIKGKLPELQRCSYSERLKLLFTDIFHEISDSLESRATPDDLLNQIGELVSRRNKFIHRGETTDMKLAYRDVCFTRFMVGLWVLKLLDYPLDKINPLGHDLFGSTTK
jgi:hypothetical protein